MKEGMKTDIERDSRNRQGNVVMSSSLRNVVIQRQKPRPKLPPSDSIRQYRTVVAGRIQPLSDLNECSLSLASSL